MDQRLLHGVTLLGIVLSVFPFVVILRGRTLPGEGGASHGVEFPGAQAEDQLCGSVVGGADQRYGMFLKATGYSHASRFASHPQPNGAKQPVVGIGWQDAEDYCQWAGKRLPREEECA